MAVRIPVQIPNIFPYNDTMVALIPTKNNVVDMNVPVPSIRQEIPSARSVYPTSGMAQSSPIISGETGLAQPPQLISNTEPLNIKSVESGEIQSSGTHISDVFWNDLDKDEKQEQIDMASGDVFIHDESGKVIETIRKGESAISEDGAPIVTTPKVDITNYTKETGQAGELVKTIIDDARTSYKTQLEAAEKERMVKVKNAYDVAANEAASNEQTLTVGRDEYIRKSQEQPLFGISEDEYVKSMLDNNSDIINSVKQSEILQPEVTQEIGGTQQVIGGAQPVLDVSMYKTVSDVKNAIVSGALTQSQVSDTFDSATVTAVNSLQVQDPITKNWYPSDWYKTSLIDKATEDPLDVADMIQDGADGTSYEDAVAAANQIMATGGIQGVLDHFQGIADEQAKLQDIELQYNLEKIATDSGLSLATIQKVYKESGIDGINSTLAGVQYENAMAASTPKSGNDALNEMIKNGTIPANSVLKDFDPVTGKLSYTTFKAINTPSESVEKKFLADDRVQVQYEALDAVGIYTGWENWSMFISSGGAAKVDQKTFDYLKIKSPTEIYNSLTKEEQDRVLSAYRQWQGWGTEISQFSKEMGEIAVVYVPVVGTAVMWNQMSGPWKAASVISDILFVLPAIKTATVIARAAASEIKTAEIIRTTEALVAREAANPASIERSVITNLGSDVTEALAELRTNQGIYASILAREVEPSVATVSKVSKVSSVIKDAIVRPSELVARNISSTDSKAILKQADDLIKAKGDIKSAKLVAEQKLKDSASNFVKVIGPKIGGDTPDLLNNLPKTIVHQTRSLVDSLQGTNLVAIKIEMDNAYNSLQNAIAKANSSKRVADPSQWADLAQEYTALQSKYQIASAGSITKLYNDLLEARVEYESLQSQADALLKSEGMSINFQNIESSRIASLDKITDLNDRINKAVKNMEVEASVNPWSTYGSSPVLTAPNPTLAPSAPIVSSESTIRGSLVSGRGLAARGVVASSYSSPTSQMVNSIVAKFGTSYGSPSSMDKVGEMVAMVSESDTVPVIGLNGLSKGIGLSTLAAMSPSEIGIAYGPSPIVDNVTMTPSGVPEYAIIKLADVIANKVLTTTIVSKDQGTLVEIPLIDAIEVNLNSQLAVIPEIGIREEVRVQAITNMMNQYQNDMALQNMLGYDLSNKLSNLIQPKTGKMERVDYSKINQNDYQYELEPKTETSPKTETKTQVKTDIQTKTVTEIDKTKIKLRFPIIPIPDSDNDKKITKGSKGAVGLYQGTLKNGKEVWYIIRWPYTQHSDAFKIVVEEGKLPSWITPVTKGKGASYRSIQLITGIPPERLTLDLGIQDITITGNGKNRKPTVKYTRDRKQKTKSMINLKSLGTVR